MEAIVEKISGLRGFVFVYEHYSQPLISVGAYLKRQGLHAAAAVLMITGSLFLGMAGYHWLEGLSWTDALVNAAMILGGMGPVNALQTRAGKVFASFYALYSGIVFLIAAGVVFAPAFHRFLHKFHLEEEPKDPS
ncbi:MAG TPA: hypothetical protein PLT45_01750 [Smithella sp.]|nr:hypothetical protein [Smithella sp.]